MDKKVMRSALLKQLVRDVGSNRVKSYKAEPSDDDLKEMDPKDVEGTGFEDRAVEEKPKVFKIEPADTEEDEDEEIPESVRQFLEERRDRRRQQVK